MATTTTALTDLEELNLSAVTDVLEFWNKQDIEGILTFYDDEIRWRNVAIEQFLRRHKSRRVRITRRWRGAFRRSRRCGNGNARKNQHRDANKLWFHKSL